MKETSFRPISWFFRRLAAVALNEEAGSEVMGHVSHKDVLRFLLRRCALKVPLGAPRAFFLVGGSAAAIVGATVAL